jgi:MSHA biogenesis protein MshQ
MQLLNSTNPVTLNATATSPSAASTTTCNFTNCSYSAADSALLFSSIPDHVSDTTQAFTISAVKKADNSLSCTPAFASVTKTVNFACSYVNPSSGTWAPQVAGVALNSAGSATSACDSGGKSLSLNFNASGVASTATISGASTALNVRYADVGRLQLTATYSGSGSDSGLTMSGTSSFTVAPSSFAWSNLPATTVKAGNTFSGTVTAKNASGTTTPNYGREASPQVPTISLSRYTPTGTNTRDGSFTTGAVGSFSSGAATVSGMAWDEVGTLNFSAQIASYLGSGLSASGSTTTGPVRVTPDHFDMAVTPGCSTGSTAFTYAGSLVTGQTLVGQSLVVDLTARNAAGGTTQNYDGQASTANSPARNLSFTEVSALGGALVTANAIGASSFYQGLSTGSAGSLHGQVYYQFASKTTAPGALKLRATDTDNISTAGYESASGYTLRSGRLRVANGFGSEKSTLALTVTAEYWNGSAWVKNGDDSCTQVGSSAVVVSNIRNAQGGAGSWTTSATGPSTLSSGSGQITLSAPNSTGSLDLAINLGSSPAVDQSCNLNHPSSTGLGAQWLRSRNGAGPSAACSTSPWDRDPSAHVSFGIYTPESKKAVHAREIF